MESGKSPIATETRQRAPLKADSAHAPKGNVRLRECSALPREIVGDGLEAVAGDSDRGAPDSTSEGRKVAAEALRVVPPRGMSHAVVDE